MADVALFWQEVREERDIAFAAVQQQKLQPKNIALVRPHVPGDYKGFCFIISVKDRDLQTVAGKVSEVPFNLCGQRIREGGHRLATDQEITDWRKECAERGDDLKRRERLRIANNSGGMQLESK